MRKVVVASATRAQEKASGPKLACGRAVPADNSRLPRWEQALSSETGPSATMATLIVHASSLLKFDEPTNKWEEFYFVLRPAVLEYHVPDIELSLTPPMMPLLYRTLLRAKKKLFSSGDMVQLASLAFFNHHFLGPHDVQPANEAWNGGGRAGGWSRYPGVQCALSLLTKTDDGKRAQSEVTRPTGLTSVRSTVKTHVSEGSCRRLTTFSTTA